MRIHFALLCFLVSIVPWFAKSPGRNDEAAIREVVSKYVDARERIDPKAVEELFTSDADQLVSSGEWRKGRDAVVQGTMASSRNSGGRRSVTVESVRFVTPDVAIADGRYELTGLSGGASRSMWTTLVLKRTNKGWRISAIRNMLPIGSHNVSGNRIRHCWRAPTSAPPYHGEQPKGRNELAEELCASLADMS